MANLSNERDELISGMTSPEVSKIIAIANKDTKKTLNFPTSSKNDKFQSEFWAVQKLGSTVPQSSMGLEQVILKPYDVKLIKSEVTEIVAMEEFLTLSSATTTIAMQDQNLEDTMDRDRMIERLYKLL